MANERSMIHQVQRSWSAMVTPHSESSIQVGGPESNEKRMALALMTWRCNLEMESSEWKAAEIQKVEQEPRSAVVKLHFEALLPGESGPLYG
jgi:hypothetical protein